MTGRPTVPDDNQLDLFGTSPAARAIKAKQPTQKERLQRGRPPPTLALGWPCPECGSSEVDDPEVPCDLCAEAILAASMAAHEAELEQWRMYHLLRLELGEDVYHCLVVENFYEPLECEDAIAARAECALKDSADYFSYTASSFRAQDRRAQSYARSWRQRNAWLDRRPFLVPDELPLERPVDFLLCDDNWEYEWEEEFANGDRVGELVWYPARPVVEVDIGLCL